MPPFSRRDFLRAAGLLAGSAVLGRAAPARSRPNVLLIMADDMGFSDLGCYGGEIRTPNLDRLAQGGIRFTQFYNNAKCGPTRASLLTGQYSQAVGGGAMGRAVTIAEALRPAGYRTLMTGKWHAPSLPVRRGFDRYFGLADGCCNYFNPGKQRPGEPPPGRKWKRWRRWAIDEKEFKPYTPEDPDFYTTDAFTDYALQYLERYRGEDKPFFLYLAYTAPHYPLHAWPQDIARYRGTYRKGWDELRRERHARMLDMGLVDPQWPLSPRDPRCPAWDEVGKKDEWELKMAVYAAMVDRMDQNIGRLLAKLEDLGELDDTLILFLSDNGGCAENVNKTPDIPPGPLPSYRTVDRPWANASNTPFRKYKRYDHEGGIATPLIAHWPAGIRQRGAITHQWGHIVDILPTCLEVAGAPYPEERDGQEILPLEGKSLLPVLQGEKREGHESICWQFSSARAVRQGKWKLVVDGKGPWELYDLEVDRTELHDLASTHPQKVEELAAVWNAWAERVGARRRSR